MSVEAQIKETLKQLEIERECKVLYACESGSRAWGFDSPDSDYDIRFIYVHHSDWYLSIENHRDVIERMLPNDLDVSGWELRKALGLMRKSNPPFFEWLRSPIVYSERPRVMEEFRALALTSYSPERCFYHYRSMARGNVRNYFDRDQMPLKKYLYVLRPILACKWIQADLGPAPMEFQTMVDALVPHSELRSDIDALVERKRQSSEMGEGEKIDSIQRFIESELEQIEKTKIAYRPLPEIGPIDAFLRKTISDFSRL